MARKYDRYGRNRQFRRNPTRSRKFFPNKLPFQSDFRLMLDRNTPVSAATAAHWRQVVADISNPNKRARNDDEDYDGMYGRMHKLSQSSQLSFLGRQARYGVEAAIIAEVPLAAIPIAGLEMIINPKKASTRFGGGVIAVTGGIGVLAAKNLI